MLQFYWYFCHCEKPPEKYEKIQTKIKKVINPYLTIKILIPEGADRKALFKLENNAAFLELINHEDKKRLKKVAVNRFSHLKRIYCLNAVCL
jgi:hypothetical protein